MFVVAFFLDKQGDPATGLTPTLSAWRESDDGLELNEVSMSEVSGGWYKYDFTAYSSSEGYMYRADGGVDIGRKRRYASGHQPPVASSNSDWTTDERNQIRDALGIDGTKVAALNGDLQTILTNTNRVNGLVENVSGDRFTQKALEQAPSDGGLTAQEVRDSMKLAPSTGVPSAGSIDEHLDNIDAKTINLPSDPAQEASVQANKKLLEADQVFDYDLGLIHYYERGTTTDLIPAKTVSGTNVNQDVNVTE